MKLKHQEHIVCIKASHVVHRDAGTVDYEFRLQDLMLGQRAVLENDEDFRQVLPISVFTHKGAVWAYERTSKGGETRLHNKVAVAVGGHWDFADIVVSDSVIDLGASLRKAIDRELTEEVRLNANILNSYRLPRAICADDNEVDRVHIGMVWVHELDSESLFSAEDALQTIGFVKIEDLLTDAYNTETWAQIICRMIIETDFGRNIS